MKRVEEMMGWSREDRIGCDVWIDHLGQYRSDATVDDILSWFLSENYMMSGSHYSPAVGQYIVTLLGPSGDVVALGTTVYSALVNAVHAYKESQ